MFIEPLFAPRKHLKEIDKMLKNVMPLSNIHSHDKVLYLNIICVRCNEKKYILLNFNPFFLRGLD